MAIVYPCSQDDERNCHLNKSSGIYWNEKNWNMPLPAMRHHIKPGLCRGGIARSS